MTLITDGAHLPLPLTSDKASIHAAIREIREAMAGGSMRKAYDMEDRVARLASAGDRAQEAAITPTDGRASASLRSESNLDLKSGDALNALFEKAKRFQQ